MKDFLYKKRNILLAGPFPPPSGGVAAINELIYKSNKSINNNLYRIIPLDASHLKRKVYIKSSTGIINLVNQFLQLLYLIYLMIRYNCQIIHISFSSYKSFYKGSAFSLIALLFGKKAIIHLHGGSFKIFYEKSNNGIKRLIEYIFKKSECVIVLSYYWIKLVVDILKVPEKNVCILNNCYGLDMNELGDGLNEKKGEDRDKKIHLLFIGGLSRDKGVLDLIEICAELNKYLNNFVLLIAGAEKELGIKEIIRNKIDRKNISSHIKLLGEVWGKNKLELFKKADIFILPSYIENFPVTILEAMRAGLPVISTSVGAIPDIITNNKNGYLIEPGDVATFSDKIVSLYKNKRLRAAMGKKNIGEALNKYDPKNYLLRLIKIYDRVLKNDIHIERK